VSACLSSCVAVAAVYTEQAQVTNWPARLALMGVVFGVIALTVWGMWRGWLGRRERQSDVPAPMSIEDQGASATADESVAGLYVGSATAGDWLDRIAVHGLGVRSRGWLAWSRDGIAVTRQGAPSFFIPAGAIHGIRVDRGVAGTVRAKDSMVVITWKLGQRAVDTGFRADDSTEHGRLLDGLVATYPEVSHA
jgi:hypothetical protein